MIRTVFLDAVGTLIEVAEPVGETYARFARASGLAADAAALDRAFRSAFTAAPPLAFPGASPAERPRLEREWWRRVVLAAYSAAGVEGAGEARERAFSAVFEHFATKAAWRIFSDVAPALGELRSRGVRLAIVSNFDGRLRAIVRALALEPLFEAVVPSSEHGAAKPAAAIFEAALRASRADRASTMHVGDSDELDRRAALAAGLQALRIDRAAASSEQSIATLGELPQRLVARSRGDALTCRRRSI